MTDDATELAKAAARRLRRAAREAPGFEQTVEYLIIEMNEDAHGSDRLVALLAGTLLEEALQIRIETKMRTDLSDDEHGQIFDVDRRGILASFGSRILVAYALKLFGPKTFSDLKQIKLIRNAFAHSLLPLHFEHPEIKALCESLGVYELQRWETIEAFDTFARSDVVTAKRKFLRSAISISVCLQLQVKVMPGEQRFQRKPLP